MRVEGAVPELAGTERQLDLRDGASCSSDRAAGELIHVLFLIDQLSQLGGAERILVNTIQFLPKNRFRCSLATFRDELDPSVLQQLRCPVYRLPLRRTYDLNAARVAGSLRRLIRDERVDITHTFFETSDIWGGLVAKLSGCPILISSRRDVGILRSRKHHLAYRLMRPLVDRVLAVSAEVRNYSVRQDGLEPNRVVTIYNGVDMVKFLSPNGAARIRASLGLTEASPIITTVANIRHVKGIDVFIRAAALVSQEFPKAVFLVVGEVLEKQHCRDLRQLTSDLGLLDNVKFLGPSKEIPSLLKLSDVFCLTSRSEGFSNALVEAMACGLPCVATRVGGNGEAIEDNVNGFLVPPEDPQTVAHRILTLLRQPETARAMGRAAQTTVQQQFTTEAMIRQLVSVYDDLIQSKRQVRCRGLGVRRPSHVVR